MTSVDGMTRRVLGLESLLSRVTPRSETAARRWRQLSSQRFVAASGRRERLDRLRRLDNALSPETIDTIDADLGQLPTLERPFRRLDAGEVLKDADFFELKRFFYQSVRILEAVDGLDGLPGPESKSAELLRHAMATIHPENEPSARFHLADELSQALAAGRKQRRRIRRELKKLRRDLEAQVLQGVEGKFDIHGRFHPADAAQITDDRLVFERGQYRLSTPELDALQARFEKQGHEVLGLESQQRERLTRFIETIEQEIAELHEQLVRFDLRIARVELRRQLQGCWPHFVDGQEAWLSIREGREPSLVREIGADEVQPVDVALERPGTVVTGPNMGGKSVLLRLIGVVQWCAQLALPVPGVECAVRDVSHIVYIGSEEPGRSEATEGLSSFGREVRRFVEHWDVEGPILWLLDEPGRGTHPDEGARLAAEISEKLVDRGDYVVMATHFPSLANNDGFASLQIAGLDVDDATLEEALADVRQGATTLQALLRRFMDYRVVEADNAQVPRDARRVACALGLKLESPIVPTPSVPSESNRYPDGGNTRH